MHVETLKNEISMGKLIHRKKKFLKFRFARYAVDVTLQLSYRPSGSVNEANSYKSRIQKA